MKYSVPKEIAEANHRFRIMNSSNQFNHRAMVLQSVCELEFRCAQLLFAHFKSRNTKKTWGQAQKELFGENGLLGSLTRMVKIGAYLGILDEDECKDLRLLAKLRNLYAHGREREQFYEDPTAASIIRNLCLYNQSPTLEHHDEQGIFLSCYKFLDLRLRQRAKFIELPDGA